MNQDSIHQDIQAVQTSPLQKTLADIKSKLGFRSARAFYDQHLMGRTRLDFNYSYYMKIEGGKIIPSSQIISNLCSAFEEEDAQEIMLSYCETIFPERASVFKTAKGAKRNTVKKSALGMQIAQVSASSTQTYLTQAQIACLSQTKMHYFAFLLLTLARRPIPVSELKASLPKVKNIGEKEREEEIETLVEEFIKAKLIKIQNEQMSSIATDMKFPVQDSPMLKKIYDQMDLWSIAFYKEMNFAPVVQKMMLRRVSSRYLSVIEAHCNVMIDLIRASDELDPESNDEVLMLNVSIQRGNLPG